jgi:magnesium transporter
MSESLSSPAKMLYRLFQLLVEDDRRLFDVIYGQLAALEQEIPRDNTRFFYQKMYVMKRTVYERFRYYQQLVEVGEDLMEWECELLEQKEMQRFERFLVRTSRLADDMEILREYTMEIWEIYQSQISIRQNDIMKVLTIVTTIFLPLTLLVGWYGMNFETMPELSWKYGYGTVIFVSASIVLFLLLFFRKKKYW